MIPMDLTLTPVGIVHSPYLKRGDAPRQGRFSDILSRIEIFDPYAPGLKDIEDHTHLVILCWFDRSSRKELFATPPGSGKEHGVFATRSPERPNPLGLSLVDLVSREGPVLTVRGLDAFDGTPVIDIKPHIPDLDCVKPDTKIKGNGRQVLPSP